MRVFLLLAAFFLAAPAFAALAPQYYEEARANAESVIVIAVESVDGLRSGGDGECRVNGRVAAVERGARYSVGAAVRVAVPCRRAGAVVPASGVQYEDEAELRRSRWGRAWLDANGELALYQYEILPSAPDAAAPPAKPAL